MKKTLEKIIIIGGKVLAALKVLKEIIFQNNDNNPNNHPQIS